MNNELDVQVAEILVRLIALENLLIKKNLILGEEIVKEMKGITDSVVAALASKESESK